MKNLIALLLSVLLAASLCACGSSGGGSTADTPVYGTYTLYAMDYNDGYTVLAEDLFDGESYVTLNEGGSAEICLEGDKSEVTWTQDGTKIVFSASDGDLSATVKEGILTMVLGENNLYFVTSTASTASIGAISLNEMLDEMAEAEDDDDDDADTDDDDDDTDTDSGDRSALLGASPTKLDINDRGVAYVYYPSDKFEYDDWYGKLKNESDGVGILLDPMLGSANFDELKKSYEENNSDEDDYSLVDTTINGYKAMVLKYSDWLGATMRVDIDFGGDHDGWYGLSFSVTADELDDCDSDIVWAIIESLELAD